ncbi:hypothetical protein PF003_g22715 [Phytophthora fragariae]|nr:hypothetical protein PF003_g22715 [Phytophthora fragariae]
MYGISTSVLAMKYHSAFHGHDATPVRSVGGAAASSTAQNDALGLSYLIRAYQVRGHEAANLDPLGLQERPALPELDIQMYGFTEKDLDRVIAIPKNFSSGDSGFLEELSDGNNSMTLGQIIQRLKETYCSSIGVLMMPKKTVLTKIRPMPAFAPLYVL